MNQFNQNQTSQIRAILSWFYIGQDSWARSQLPKGESFSEVAYEQVFNVTEDDVLAYVHRFGWDDRTVASLDGMPRYQSEVSLNWRFFVVKNSGAGWVCGRAKDMERSNVPFDIWTFSTQEDMERFMARDFIEEQMRLWGPRPKINGRNP